MERRFESAANSVQEMMALALFGSVSRAGEVVSGCASWAVSHAYGRSGTLSGESTIRCKVTFDDSWRTQSG